MTADQNIEYQWLDERKKIIRAELDEIAKGAKESGWPNALEDAVSHLETAIDRIGDRMDDLDEGRA